MFVKSILKNALNLQIDYLNAHWQQLRLVQEEPT